VAFDIKGRVIRNPFSICAKRFTNLSRAEKTAAAGAAFSTMTGIAPCYTANCRQGKVQMRNHVFTALAMLMLAPAAQAEGQRAGDFDYFVMALSYSPNWCARTGDARRDPQCEDGRGYTWVLHGLWPQYEEGWPSFCRTPHGDPSRAQTAAMADIMGSSGPAFYQWKKHGRCSGLPAEDYFNTSRAAYESIKLPKLFEQITRDLTVPASVIEDAFTEANPTLKRDQITITCTNGMIAEARICLNTDLTPRRCGADVIRDCTLQDAGLGAVR
jgi:ribonuclease T2